jgi:4-aminobutyrate aminotransferase/(S)-3-amino-2-methylpropionate transaminase
MAVARRLAELAPGSFAKKTLLVNSGAEAVENAVKIARLHTGRPAVVTFENAFHGRTLLTMSLTSKVNPYKLNFGPFAPEIYRAPSPYCYRCPLGLGAPDCEMACLRLLERTIAVDIGEDQVAAVIIEPVQGEGGFIPLPEGYLARLQRLCAKHGILLIVDEIQTGFGRTGKLLACEHHGVAPDLLVLAKGLAAGLPLSAVVGRADVMDSVHAGGIGGTYSGNPVACAAALAVMDIMEKEALPARAARIGATLTSRLRKMAGRLPAIGDVRGLGAMVAIELVEPGRERLPAPKAASNVIRRCYEQGLVVLKAGIHDNCVRALPPLVITDEQLEAAVTIWEMALLEVLG